MRPWMAAFLTCTALACLAERAPAPRRDEVSKDALERRGMEAQSAPVVATADAVAGGRVTEGDAEFSRPIADPSLAGVMVIRTGQASVEVDSLETSVAQLRQLAGRLGGYLANSSYQAGSAQYRSASIELRVPSQRFDELLSGMSPLGKVEYVNVTAEDVGEEYADVGARIANGKRLEARLIDLLANRTGKLQDILEVERELARVREEIERYEGRLRYLQAHASMSSLTVSVHEPLPIQGAYRGSPVIAEAFQRAWRNFVNLNASFIESLGVVLPLGLIGLAGVMTIRRWWRRRLRVAVSSAQ
jgi:uncharacterized protein DUF4349